MNVNRIEGGIFMNYNKPELETLELEMVDVITGSTGRLEDSTEGEGTQITTPDIDW